MKKWRIEDSEELYNIKGWGVNYFGINDKGHVYVTPKKNGVQVDLQEVIDELSTRHVTAPVLLRFPDILDNRIEKTDECFRKAAKEYDYQAEHFIIFPIKVNQMRPVVEEIISHGKRYNLGLEAGSKPELHAVLATNMDSDSLIICNGHKDQNFIELALLAQKMGKRVFLVIEKLPELQIIAETAKRLGVRPNLGIRIKLAANGSGKWSESGGDASKFGLNSSELHEVFADWNKTELDSYLIEITRDIFGYRDENGETTVEHILDKAGQKGTGKWTGIAALDEAVPLTLISEAVFARCLSAEKDERVEAAKLYPHEIPAFTGDRTAFIEAIRKALYASKIVSYAQGYTLMRAAAKTYGWNLNYGGIALMWRGGCIIRSVFLGKIKDAFDKNPALENLLMDDYFASVMQTLIPAWREVVAYAVKVGIPMPAFSSALAWFDGYTTERLPANLLQAQRDYFGAHTYERIDAPRGTFFHTNWTGHGGSTSASTYNA